MFNKIRLFSIYVLLIFFSACAQMVAPSGGKKDVIPPVLNVVYPPNKSINFTNKKIVFSFNENIQLNKANEQIVFSPPLNKSPDVLVNGKTVTIKFGEDFLPNTTYTVNFNDAIGDNTENNKIHGLQYVFSTGETIDSNVIKGKILNAFTNKPEKGISVGLYNTDTFNDSIIYKEKPIYIGKTSENGDFIIENLPTLNYNVIAFNDANQNLKYDKLEHIAYLNKSVSSADTNAFLLMHLFTPNLYLINHIIDTFCAAPQKFNFVVYKPENIEIKSINKKSYTNYISGNSNIDTFQIFVENPDSNTSFSLTINNLQSIINLPNYSTHNIQKLNTTYTKRLELNDTFIVQFNNPIVTLDTSKIELYKDTIEIPIKYLHFTPFSIKVFYPWDEKTNYSIKIKDSACKDVFNQWNDSITNKFTTNSLADYGNLQLHVQVKKKGKYILQLLTNDEKNIVKSFAIDKNQDIEITNLLPATYTIKYITDENNNGKWDNGNYNEKIQPEKVGYYTEPIVIRAYWDLEQSIIIE